MGAHISMSIFIVLGAYPVYWALTTCKIEVGGVNVIAII